MKRIVRERRLTTEEAEEYQSIRDQIAEELPDLITRHHEPMKRGTPHLEGWGMLDWQAVGGRPSGISYRLASGKSGDIVDPYILKVFYSRLCRAMTKAGREGPTKRKVPVGEGPAQTADDRAK